MENIRVQENCGVYWARHVEGTVFDVGIGEINFLFCSVQRGAHFGLQFNYIFPFCFRSSKRHTENDVWKEFRSVVYKIDNIRKIQCTIEIRIRMHEEKDTFRYVSECLLTPKIPILFYPFNSPRLRMKLEIFVTHGKMNIFLHQFISYVDRMRDDDVFYQHVVWLRIMYVNSSAYSFNEANPTKNCRTPKLHTLQLMRMHHIVACQVRWLKRSLWTYVHLNHKGAVTFLFWFNICRVCVWELMLYKSAKFKWTLSKRFWIQTQPKRRSRLLCVHPARANE